jgi:PPOX class probable F420-dependent enzyme
MPTPPIPDELQAMLAKPNPSVIATLKADGSPLTSATWYVWDDGRVLVNMDAGRKRLEHMRRDPRVAIDVLDEAGWYRHVSIQGRVASLEDDPDFVDIDRISRHYTGKPYSNRERPRVSAWIEVLRWFAWNGGEPWGF